jgi:hypothetical protein
MAASHWGAFMAVPTLLMKDWPSIIFHAIISKLDKSLIEMSRTSFPNNTIVPFLVDGVAYTFRQDYGIALIGEGDKIPNAGVKAGLY